MKHEKQDIPKLLNDLKGVEAPEAVVYICAHEIDRLMGFRTTDASLRTALTGYRAAVAKAYGEDHPAMGCLTIGKAKNTKLTNDYAKQVATRQREVTVISDLKGYLKMSEDLLGERSYIKRMLGLMALTGRREAELLCSAVFTPIGKHDPRGVIFEGQAKNEKRGKVVEPRGPFRIPVLASPAVIVAATKQLQADQPDLWGDTKKASNRVTKQISQQVKRLYGPLIHPDMTGHDLRKIYIALAYHYEDVPQTITRQRYTSDMLGHGPYDNTTGGSYMDFVVREK